MSSQPEAIATAGSETAVKRRRVFYIPGFDPLPPRRYRELYRKEAAAQAAITGYEITLTARAPGEVRFGWKVVARIEGVRTETDVDVLIWSDIVKTSMSPGIAATYLQLARTAWIYLSTGALARLMRLRKGPVLAAFYPVVFLLLQLGLALAAALGMAAALRSLVPAAGPVLAVLCGVAAAYGVLRWFRVRDGRFYAYYLMHDYAFSASEWGAYPHALTARLREFAQDVRAALSLDYDEVLIVGHSSGTHLAVSVLADVLRASPDARVRGPTLSFLSLGQVVPMVSFLPRADRLRGDLQDVSRSGALTWVDVSAPGDGCSFALCDPVAVTGVAEQDKRWPLVLSAALTQTLSAERWRALRRRFFRLHFQYLCAFDRPGDYDYFQITAGPRTLAARFADRAPSPSRVERPLSRYRSVGRR